MKLLHCPLNGPRNISEFLCLGEVKPIPDSLAHSTEWADFVFLENNSAGVVREWWMHTATSYLFIVERDTRSDTIIRTYPSELPTAEKVSAPTMEDRK